MHHSRRKATTGVSVFTNPVSSHEAPSTQSVEDITDLADPVNMNTHSSSAERPREQALRTRAGRLKKISCGQRTKWQEHFELMMKV